MVHRPQVLPAQHPPDTFSTGAQPKAHDCKDPEQDPLLQLKILFLARHQPDASTTVDENGSRYKRWQAMRDLPNEEQIVEAVKATALAWNTHLCAFQQVRAHGLCQVDGYLYQGNTWCMSCCI